jgi:hypothetical protein
MKEKKNKQYGYGLVFTIAVSVLLFLPALAVWLLNVEQALRAVGVPCDGISGVLPEHVTTMLLPLTVDLSTITTLVPVLLFGFPIFMGARVLLRRRRDPGYIHRMIYDPYPPHFPFFLVMLGLTGTLYGLLIGLSSSGVDEIAAAAPSADNIRETVDRLLAGTATALLSSLLGLVGAFLASRPFTWIFRAAVGIPEEESSRSLSETVSELTRDMQALSHASREFSERLNAASADAIAQRLAEIESAVGRLAASVEKESAGVGELVALQLQLIDRLAPLEQLKRLEAIERSGAALVGSAEAGGRKLNELQSGQQRIISGVEALNAGLGDGREELRARLDELSRLLGDSRNDNRRERTALRAAIGHYIESLTGRDEQR